MATMKLQRPQRRISSGEKGASRARLRMNLLKEIRALFRKRATEQSLTQREIASRLGCSESLVSRFLNGDENVTLNTVADFALAMDATPHFFVVPNEVLAHQMSGTSPISNAWAVLQGEHAAYASLSYHHLPSLDPSQIDAVVTVTAAGLVITSSVPEPLRPEIVASGWTTSALSTKRPRPISDVARFTRVM